MSSRSVRLVALASAGLFLAVALTIRIVGAGALDSTGQLEQYTGTALYASTVYAGVRFLRPRTSAYVVGGVALAFCWAVEFAQLTGLPAVLSAHSVVARLALGRVFDWTDVLWYPVGIVPLVVLDRVFMDRQLRGQQRS